MTRILRITRHPATEDQLLELLRIYGENIEIVEVSETIKAVGRVIQLVAEHKADVLEAVLPLPILSELVCDCDLVGVPVIRAVMDRKINGDESITFSFSHYERIKKIVVETERL